MRPACQPQWTEIKDAAMTGMIDTPVYQRPWNIKVPAARPKPDVSIVMPCLNEADAVGACVRETLWTLNEYGLNGEVIVADNGSTDGSQEIASGLGALVVPVQSRGYGSALMGGFAAARGDLLIMSDA